jgi:hypothetical protein
MSLPNFAFVSIFLIFSERHRQPNTLLRTSTKQKILSRNISFSFCVFIIHFIHRRRASKMKFGFARTFNTRHFVLQFIVNLTLSFSSSFF